MAAPPADTLAEAYDTLTRDCGVLDRSERGKLALSGSDAAEFLGGQVTNELADLEVGQGRYAAFLTHKGKMLGDLRILSVRAPDGSLELALDTERAALQALFDMIRRFKVGYAVELHKRTIERGLLSLIGPRSLELTGTDPDAEEHDNRPVEIGGLQALAIRTDLGVDLLCAAEDTAPLALALGVPAVSETAAECLRIESGRPRFGIDLDETVIPQEAGLNDRAVSFTKGCYVGQETVARLHYKGKPNRHLRGLRLSGAAAPGQELFLGERLVGHLGSYADSPRLGPIGLGLIRREAEPGVTLQGGGGAVEATVLELPFD